MQTISIPSYMNIHSEYSYASKADAGRFIAQHKEHLKTGTYFFIIYTKSDKCEYHTVKLSNQSGLIGVSYNKPIIYTKSSINNEYYKGMINTGNTSSETLNEFLLKQIQNKDPMPLSSVSLKYNMSNSTNRVTTRNSPVPFLTANGGRRKTRRHRNRKHKTRKH